MRMNQYTSGDKIPEDPDLIAWSDADEDQQRRGRYFVVVIFDISDNRLRYRMGKLLSSYGFRVQRSAFECFLTMRQFNNLIVEARSLIDIETDLLRIYRFSSQPDVVIFGSVGPIDDDELIII